jgi:hypothetical protein
MKRLIISLALGAVLLPGALLGSNAYAAESQVLAGKLRKYASTTQAPPKVPCVCQDGGPNHNRVGWTRYTSFGGPNATELYEAWCSVLTFDVLGAVVGTPSCYDWAPLAK